MSEFLMVVAITFAQNASFTLVSRARNSSSLAYHGGAAILSNGLYLLVFQKLSMSLGSMEVMTAYLIGSVSGSVAMHWFAMKKLENKKVPAKVKVRR